MRSTRLYWTSVLVGVVVSTPWAPALGRATARSATAAAPAGIVAALRVSPEAPELKARPGLVGRLRETPHNYFRFVNRPFYEAACGLFDDVRASLPEVTLHGDAHVEQYAVTSLGRGLTDFDDSARGPYVIDLVRFGVSLELAAREKGWMGAGGAIADLLRGYRDALSNPRLERPPRRTLRRARAGFAFDHALALRRAEALIDSDPVSPSELEGDFQGYVTGIRMRSPDLPASFFRIKKAGRLSMGIGSALDEKYLLRIEGWTEKESDDQILEAKLVRTLADTGCLHADAGPERVPLGMSLIARASFPYSGLFAHGDRSLWVHGWTDDYVELSIASSFPQPRDLRQVAYDVGTQLARAHQNGGPGKASPRDLGALLLESTRRNEGRLLRVIDEMTEATVEAWRVFRGETPALPPDPRVPASPARRTRRAGHRVGPRRPDWPGRPCGEGRPMSVGCFVPASSISSAALTAAIHSDVARLEAVVAALPDQSWGAAGLRSRPSQCQRSRTAWGGPPSTRLPPKGIKSPGRAILLSRMPSGTWRRPAHDSVARKAER